MSQIKTQLKKPIIEILYKTKLRNLKTSKNNERNTQKECQGRQQTRKLQNQEKEFSKNWTILDVNSQQDTIFFLNIGMWKQERL